MYEETGEGLDPLALERQVCFAAVTASRSVVALYRPLLEPLRLTHPQYLVMLALWERSPRTLRGLADALVLEPPTLTPLLKRLEVVGYLVRERNPRDERELRITLTEQGRTLRQRAEAIPARIVQQLGVPLQHLEQLRRSADELGAAARTANTNAAAAAAD